MESVDRNERSSYRRLVAALVIASILTAASPAPADYDSLQWFYKTCHGSFADGMAASFSLMVALPFGSACSVPLLPLDIAYEIAHPETKFGYYTEKVCMYPLVGVAAASYAVFGAPFFALQWLLWDAYLEPCPEGWRKGAKQPETKPAEQE